MVDDPALIFVNKTPQYYVLLNYHFPHAIARIRYNLSYYGSTSILTYCYFDCCEMFTDVWILLYWLQKNRYIDIATLNIFEVAMYLLKKSLIVII